jgi:hypothetical protein
VPCQRPNPSNSQGSGAAEKWACPLLQQKFPLGKLRRQLFRRSIECRADRGGGYSPTGLRENVSGVEGGVSYRGRCRWVEGQFEHAPKQVKIHQTSKKINELKRQARSVARAGPAKMLGLMPCPEGAWPRPAHYLAGVGKRDAPCMLPFTKMDRIARPLLGPRDRE